MAEKRKKRKIIDFPKDINELQFYKNIDEEHCTVDSEGRKNGPFEKTLEKKEYFCRGNYKNNKKNGHFEIYYNSYLLAQGEYQNDVANGNWEWYYENSKRLKDVVPYIDGKRHGFTKAYYESGKLQYEAEFKEDQLDGIFKHYYENGNLHCKKIFKTGKEEGIASFYYENGQLNCTGLYEDSEKVGIWICYQENGKFECERTFKEGRKKENSNVFQEKKKTDTKVVNKSTETKKGQQQFTGSSTLKEVISLCKNKRYNEAYEILKDVDTNDLSLSDSDKEILSETYLKVGNFFENNDDKFRLCLKKAAQLDNIDGMGCYAGLTNLSKQDLYFLKNSYQKLYNEDRPAIFYADYGRVLRLIYKFDASINIQKIRELYEKAIKKNPKSTAAFLYLARLYKENLISDEGVSNVQQAEKNYDIAIRNGSNLARIELSQLYKSQMPELSFDLMNTDENLDKFIKDITTPIISNNFSLLISGPIGCGKEVFVKKLMNAIGCKYNTYSLLDFDGSLKKVAYQDSKNITRERHLDQIVEYCEENNKGCVFKDIDYAIYDDKNLTCTQVNRFSILKAISNNKLPVVLMVNDANTIDQELRNGFTFKINFSYMDAPQKEAAYKLFFNYDAPSYLRRLGGLVVDDFARVKKKARILGLLNSSLRIMELVEYEAKYKAGSSNNYLKPDTSFDYTLINSDINLPNLVDNLKEKSGTPFTILVYGPPGTGKSYFLRYMADQLGLNTLEKTSAELSSKFVGISGKNVHNMFSEAEQKKAMIILDEAEEILRDRSANEKDWTSETTNAFLTRLESTKYPVVCTTNFMEKIDKAVLRRFVFKIKFDYLTKEQNRLAFKHFFKLDPPAELDQIGGLTNGDYSTVKKKAIILDEMSNPEKLFEMLKEESQKKSKSIIKQQINLTKFDMNFVNTDTAALEKFIKNIKKEKKTQFSFLLHGPSGTGKSYYLRHIAQELGYEVIERRASDIMSKWRGETEQNIAAAFQEAKDRKAFLIFDEIDGILFNKGKNEHVWLDGQVNEFLVQMENHPYPFAGTTNYLENIEPAALRRFSIKALFDYLKPEQYDYVFEKTFGFKPTEDLGYLKKLTPSLFVNAYNKADLAEVLTDAKRCTEIFLEEAEIAGNKKKKNIPDKTFELLEIEQKPLYKKPIADMYPQVLKGFVKIYSEDMMSHGSGFFITKDGFILTNKHVVRDNKTMIVELFSGRQVPAEVLRTNSLDVALLKISNKNLCTPMPLRLEEPNPGTTVFSMGNPHDKEQVLVKGTITRYTNVNNDGVDYPRIESDAFARGGVSGGPLMDEFGNILGLNVEGWLDKDNNYKTNMGLNLQIPIIPALEALNIKIKKKG